MKTFIALRTKAVLEGAATDATTGVTAKRVVGKQLNGAPWCVKFFKDGKPLARAKAEKLFA